MTDTKAPIKGVLIDLDGVIYNDSVPIAGAAEAIKLLDDMGLPYRFITNTTMKSRHSLKIKLESMGIDCAPETIFSATYAASRYVRNIPGARCFLLLKDDAKAEFKDLESNSKNVDFVVAGDLGNALTYDILNEAFLRLINGAKLVALQKNRFWLSDSGYKMDAGPFVALLEYAANTESVLIGKPAAAFFELALADLGLPAGNVLMIGDDIESDITGASTIGIQTCLVKTGKFRPGDLGKSAVKPDFIIDSIAKLHKKSVLYC